MKEKRNKNASNPIHIVSPATATEIRRALGIKKYQTANILRAFKKAGVKV